MDQTYWRELNTSRLLSKCCFSYSAIAEKKVKEDQIDNDINLDLGKYSSRESPNF